MALLGLWGPSGQWVMEPMGSKPKRGTVPYPMGANGANATDGANGAVSSPGTPARTGKPRIQSAMPYPIDYSKMK